MASHNIIDAFYEVAEIQKDSLALATSSVKNTTQCREYSFRSLAHETNRIAQSLRDHGFSEGDRVVVMIPVGFEFLCLNYALIQNGVIPILIDPGIGLKRIKQCISETGPVGFIGVPRAHIARCLFGWGRHSIRTLITLGKRYFWGGKTLKQLLSRREGSGSRDIFPAQQDTLAAIVFTSGATGPPKGVIRTHGNFQSQISTIKKAFNMQSSEVDLPTFTPFSLLNPFLGVATILPTMPPAKPIDVDSEGIIQLIGEYGVSSFFGAPSVMNKIADYIIQNKITLPPLKRVVTAGAPVSPHLVIKLRKALSHDVRIYTPYGSTECMPVTAVESNYLTRLDIIDQTLNGAGICVGRPLSRIKVAIIGISDDSISCWSADLCLSAFEVGEIVVKSQIASPGYYNRTKDNEYSKIPDSDTFWHRMGDVGYLDDDGNVWYCGRKADMIVYDSDTLYAIACEAIFNNHPDIHRTALVLADNVLVLCIERERHVARDEESRLRDEILQLAADNSKTRVIKTVLFHPSFPVDKRHNSKISRKDLALWAGKRMLRGRPS